MDHSTVTPDAKYVAVSELESRFAEKVMLTESKVDGIIQKRLKDNVSAEIQVVERAIAYFLFNISETEKKIENAIKNSSKDLLKLFEHLEQLQEEKESLRNNSFEPSEKDFLVKTGKMAPNIEEMNIKNNFPEFSGENLFSEPESDSPEVYSTESESEFPVEDVKVIDDGTMRMYTFRMKAWKKNLGSKLDDFSSMWGEGDEQYKNIRIPKSIWQKLFEYQQVGLRWLCQLYDQNVGGILGDEMGLGKTAQTISFLASLQYSGILTKPVLIVCPATLLAQWVNEFRAWWEPLRVAVLHSSGSFKGDAYKLIKDVCTNGHILVTTYSTLQKYKRRLLGISWQVAVLDEGHKIRNPDALVTITCKQLSTPHRIILSGTPMQNNLTELWSVFDFVFPGRLGTLPVFSSQFAEPIKEGGYANANNFKVHTAYKCACILRDLINPFMLRRMKADVANSLPEKTEQIVFCKLTQIQRKMYEKLLDSEEISSVLSGKRNVLYGIDLLRKLCNHPFLLQDEIEYSDSDIVRVSGKLKVLDGLLHLWQSENKVLLFCQTKQMLDIVETYFKLAKYSYLRMDGDTSIERRKDLVDKFNNDSSIFVFLLTTRVGGLGVNLTGADRVVIFDPDWNPSTDLQARERAWRLGQKKTVSIYRLITAGTIEEKIYHRQIFKQYLTDKILKDPRQARIFKTGDLYDLFTLPDDCDNEMFGNLDTELKKRKRVKGIAKIESQTKEKVIEKSKDRRVLDELLDMNGIVNTLQENQSTSEISIVEEESTKIANEAIESLKRSRNDRNSIDINIPTWTGRSGAAGLSTPVPSSSEILEHLRSKAIIPKSNNIFGNEVKTETALSEYLILAQDLVHFLQSRGNEASSDDIVAKFRERVSGGKNSVFKKILKNVASGRKKSKIMWTLKKEFQ